MVVSNSKRTMWVLILVVLTIWSCGVSKNKASEHDSTIGQISDGIKKSEENDDFIFEMPDIVEPRTLDELFRIMPELSVIDGEDKDGLYFGSFYLNKAGELNASYGGSSARIEIQHIDRTDHEMTVYFLFQYLGNEVSDKVGPERFFFFVVTTEQIEAGLKEAEDGLFLKTLVTEIDKDDIE